MAPLIGKQLNWFMNECHDKTHVIITPEYWIFAIKHPIVMLYLL